MFQNDSFLIFLKNEYVGMSKKTLQILLPVSKLYVYESEFSI